MAPKGSDARFAVTARATYARNSGARRMSYFDDDTDDERYQALNTHAATEGIIVSLALGILLWAFIGLGVGWL